MKKYQFFVLKSKKMDFNKIPIGKSDQTSEEPHALLGEQTHPQTQEKR